MTDRDGEHRDRGDWGADPELRTLLRSMDRAHSLPPSSSAELAALVAATLRAAETPGLETVPARRAGSPRRSLPALVAAAALVVAGVVIWSVTTPDATQPVAEAPAVSATPDVMLPTASVPVASPSGSAQTSSAAPAPAETGTQLQLQPAPQLKCAVPNAEMLGLQDLAFAGSVTAIDGSLVTLDVTQVFRGDVVGPVQVQAPSADMTALLSAVSFEVGRSYLVSATDGRVTLCGFSAEDNPALHALYDQAFAG